MINVFFLIPASINPAENFRETLASSINTTLVLKWFICNFQGLIFVLFGDGLSYLRVSTLKGETQYGMSEGSYKDRCNLHHETLTQWWACKWSHANERIKKNGSYQQEGSVTWILSALWMIMVDPFLPMAPTSFRLWCLVSSGIFYGWKTTIRENTEQPSLTDSLRHQCLDMACFIEWCQRFFWKQVPLKR